MKMRALTPKERGDLGKVETLERELFGSGAMNFWSLVPLCEQGRIYVGEEQDEIVAYCICLRCWETEAAYIFSFGVTSSWQGRGIGTAFMEMVLRALQQEGIERVLLTVSPKNDRAVCLYRDRFGFKVLELAKDWYGSGEDRFHMEKKWCRPAIPSSD